jgi:hypothetical protein
VEHDTLPRFLEKAAEFLLRLAQRLSPFRDPAFERLVEFLDLLFGLLARRGILMGSTTGNIVELIQRTSFAGRPSPMRISKGIGGRLTTSPAKALSINPPRPAALSCGSVRMLKPPMSSTTSAKSERNAAFTRRVVPSGAKIWMLIGA